MRLWSVDGNRQRLDGGAMYGNAPRALWEKWTPPDAQNRIEFACRCLLARVVVRRTIIQCQIRDVVIALQFLKHVVGADLSALIDRMKQFSFEPKNSH